MGGISAHYCHFLTSIEPECHREGRRLLVIRLHKPVEERPPVALAHSDVARVLLEFHVRLAG